jgi:hypothetical protein
MNPEFSPAQLKQIRTSEYLMRFVFGGAVALAASVLGEVYGPRVGGLFLAFPALLPASLSLIKQHAGRAAAADDARGALLGSVGLVAFGLVVWRSATWRAPWLTLALALLAWTLVSVSLWWCVLRRAEPARAGESRNSDERQHD